MATQEVPVKANLNIVLKSDTEQLEEVMVGLFMAHDHG
jgi:hypothetical protein